MTLLTEEQKAKRKALLDAGLNDAQIGRRVGVPTSTIRSWRQANGFPPAQKGPLLSPEQRQEREALHASGASDVEIAQAVGATLKAVQKWRLRVGLAAQHPERAKHTPAQRAARMLLYSLGYSDGRIGREQRVHPSAVTYWRKRLNLPAHRIYRSSRQVRRNRGTDAILARIKRAVGRNLPPDIADDAVGDLCMAVLDGSIPIERIEAEARRAGNRVLDRFASRFGPRSLDEELGDDDGFRMIDMIRDERSSSWLELAGATVW